MNEGRSRRCILFAVWSLVLIIAGSFSSIADGRRTIRTKRSLFQLARTVQCSKIGSTALELLKALNCYGCWCGFGGIGEPVDELDNCCKQHDRCYDDLKDAGTCNAYTGEIYWRQYNFECVQTIATELLTSSGNNHKHHHPQCATNATTTACGRGLCSCDIQFAACVEKWNTTERKPCPYERPCVSIE